LSIARFRSDFFVVGRDQRDQMGSVFMAGSSESLRCKRGNNDT
jgi:hypothetical protein